MNMFGGDEINFHFNACVGNNGWNDIHSYSEGYSDAALVMLEMLIKLYSDESIFENFETKINVDTIVYPIIFSARHQVELFLKDEIHKIGKMRIELSYPDQRVIKTHNLNDLWQIFKDNASACDSRFEEFLVDIESRILSFAQIDLTGETFRYPYGSDGQKHLIDRSVIGLQRFYKGYKEMVQAMQGFSFLSDALVREYGVGTFTKNLSRNDLMNIARELPKRCGWGLVSFGLFKCRIKDEYNIGSKEFGEAVKLIKNHREFSSLSNDELKLVGLSESTLTNLIKEFKKTFKDIEPSNKMESIKSDFTPMVFGEKEMNIFLAIANLQSYLKANLSVEELAIVSALNEHGGLDYYSEEFDFLYEQEIIEASDSIELIVKSLAKSKTIKHVKKSLKKLGQNTLLGCF